MGAYADRLAKVRGNKLASQIRAEKCSRSKERNERLSEQKQEEIQKRLEFWRSLSHKEQLKELDKRPGKSEKQRLKIALRIAKELTEDICNSLGK